MGPFLLGVQQVNDGESGQVAIGDYKKTPPEADRAGFL
jgi:hypothetical protein